MSLKEQSDGKEAMKYLRLWKADGTPVDLNEEPDPNWLEHMKAGGESEVTETIEIATGEKYKED